MNEQLLFLILDLLGTFVFAMSGALAARQNNLDVFGIFVIAFVTACGGGIIRDICLGANPPVGLTNWHYLLAAVLASIVSVSFFDFISRLNHPVLFFDAIGLGFFSVSGAQKTLLLNGGAQAAILLGIITACGGGVIRDVLLARVPVILRKEIYASAALISSIIVVVAHSMDLNNVFKVWLPLGVCIGMRSLSIKYKVNLPTFGNIED